MTDAEAVKDIARHLCREAGFEPDEPTRDAYGFDIPDAVIQWTRFGDDARALIADPSIEQAEIPLRIYAHGDPGRVHYTDDR